jgi:SAM-dependent methyltransferase
MATGGSSGTSVAFDRAADYYDQTRTLPRETAAAQTRLLTRELAGRDPVLEVGVGTGRIAIPLAAEGVRVCGADLSLPMLRRLVAKAPDAVPVVAADATRLPFADRTFGGVVVAHLLHLVPDWELVLDELVRVLRPGGRLLINPGNFTGLSREIQERVVAAAGRDRVHAGLDPNADLAALLTPRGLVPRSLPELPKPRSRSVAERLDRIASHQHSWTWPIDPDTLQRAVEEVRAWVQTTHGDPERLEIPSRSVHWRCFELPG